MRRAAPLVPAAVFAWAAALCAVRFHGTAVPLALALWAIALVLVAAALRARPCRRAGLALAVVAVTVGAVPVSHVALVQPARDVAASFDVDGGRTLEVHAVVASKITPSASGALWLDADATVLVAGERRERVTAPVVISVAPEAVDGALDFGARITARGTARKAEEGERAVLVVFASRGVEVTEPAAGVAGATSALRTGFARLAAGLPGPGGALLPGLAVGDTSAVGAELDAAMKTASLSHLTAVSGANCAVVVGLVFGAAALLGARRWMRVTAALLALAGFVALVTPEPSVVRAAAMAAVAMLGVLLGRSAAGASALCLAIVVLLAGDPWLAVSLGFALSAAATAALLVLAPPLARGLARHLPRALALMLAVALAAQLACGPLLVLVTPTVPLYGVLANLVAGPAAAPATVLGLAACLLVPVLPWLASAIAAIAWVPSAWVAATALTVAGLPAASLPWLEGGWGVGALAVLGACVAVVILRGGSTGRRDVVLRTAAVFAISATAGGFVGGAALAGPAGVLTVPSAWSIAACDIGQGDAVLVRSAGRVAIVDTGPDPARLSACLARLGVVRLDLAVLTHYDLDHVGGTSAILGRVDLVLHGPTDSADDERLLRTLAGAGARVMDATAGMSGSLGDARWRVVWPTPRGRGFAPGNDSSVVVEFRGGGVPTSLFLGDLSASPQTALAASGRLRPPYAVVKVAHHGSADQDPGLYGILRPAVALISVGAGNDYGHPRAETLRVLSSIGATIARTDRDGLVAVAPDDDGVALWRERGPPRVTASVRRTRLEGMPARRPAAHGGAKTAIPQLPWRSPQPAPVVLVSGPEEVCAERAIAGVRDYLRAEDASLEVTDLRADDYEAGMLLAVTSPSLFGEPRLVRVQGVEKCSDAFLAEAVAYLEHPQEGATVVLRHTGASVRGKKLLDAIRAGTGGGVEVPCPAIKRDSDRYDFAAGEFAAARRRIAPTALRALVSAFSDDLTELAAACQQLLNDVPGDVTAEIVERYYGGRVETSAFTVADTAIAGRYGDALIALRQALSSGADPVPLVAAVALKLRTMARVAGTREPSAALAARLGMKDWQVDRARRDLSGWNERSLAMAIQATARADVEVKGASRDPVFALERMITVIATRTPRS